MIVVTGAAGFIGSHTCEQLLAAGHEVVGIDNFRTGRRENLQKPLTQDGFRLLECDVAAPGALLAALNGRQPAAIIHLAALVSVPESISDPAANFRLNVEATQRVIEAVRQRAIPRVVFASSAAVYGNPAAAVLTENSPTEPISPYGGAKLASEALLLSHARSYGFAACCLRYFNVFGPRQDPRSPYSGVISIFCDRMRAGTAPTIYGDGEQTRDFVSVHDVARANRLAATGGAPFCGSLNICRGKPVSLKQLTAVLARDFPRAPAPVLAPDRPGDIRHSLGSPDRAAKTIGFVAQVALEEGLHELHSP